jgi:hypothetical protein
MLYRHVEPTGAQKDHMFKTLGLMACGLILACSAPQKANEAADETISTQEDAGLQTVAILDAGALEQEPPKGDAGHFETPVLSSEDVVSVCVDIEPPDGGFLSEIGLVRAALEGQQTVVTVTLFNVNCGITEFNLRMEEIDNGTVLKTTVSPVNLSNDTPLTRCNCDMDVKATHMDTDASLQSVAAYFFSDVVLDNVDAIPVNGFIGTVNIP